MEKRRKLYLNNYEVESEGATTPFLVAVSLGELLFHPNQDIYSRDVLFRGELRRKIQGCQGESILLTEEEYNALRSAVDSWNRYDGSHEELIKRVTGAEEVEVDITEV